MNKIIFSFLVTSIAGLSTVIGTIPIFFKIKNIDKLINISLAFSSGVMASVSIFSLLPESYNYLRSILLLIFFILIGIFFTIILNKIFKYIDNKLYKLGIISMIALIIHNIPEGILTFSTTTTNVYLGLSLALSIMFHNIPEGISISVPIYFSTKSKKKAFLYTLISGFSEVIGALFTYLFLYKYINNNFIGFILSITTGIMLYISLFELLPQSLLYSKKRTYLFFIIGFIFMLIFK